MVFSRQAASHRLMGTIGFEQLKVFCIIGVHPRERENEQIVLIDLKMESDFFPSFYTDQVEDTVNYSVVVQLCQEVGRNGKFALLEKFAYEILENCFLRFKVKRAWIVVRKPAALPSAQCAFVELERNNPYLNKNTASGSYSNIRLPSKLHLIVKRWMTCGRL